MASSTDVALRTRPVQDLILEQANQSPAQVAVDNPSLARTPISTRLPARTTPWKLPGPNPALRSLLPPVATTHTSTVHFPEPLSAQKANILFYHQDQPHYGFTNFSSHEVQYEGSPYASSEHLLQCLKFIGHRQDIADRIFVCSRPAEALSEAQRFKAHQRPDWLQ